MPMTTLGRGKKALKQGLHALGLEIRRVRPGASLARPRSSNFGEEDIIRDLLGKLPLQHRFCVDIGAGDGESMSNSYALFRAGWEGLAVEWDGGRFAKLAYRYARFPGASLDRTRVTPDNVLSLFSGHGVPEEFGFLSLDIDGYDHFVLDKLLSAYRPALICAEINEKIPPPLNFTVKWHPDHKWTYDHFYGQSLTALEGLGERHGYVLAALEYNNAFLVRKAGNVLPVLPAAEAFRKGYLDRPDRLERLPWNRDMEPLIGMPVEEAKAFLHAHFKRYEGKYLLS